MIKPYKLLHILVLAALCGLCFFWRLGQPGVFDQNEALYTQAAREIAITGDWVTPHRNGIPWFDKPPLVLWMAAGAFKLMGTSPLAARLPVAISTTLLVLLVWWFGQRYFSSKAGLIAAAAMALNPLVIGTERQMTMDLVQSLWFACAMMAFFKGYTSKGATRTWWYLSFWLSCGIAFLAKSVPGLFPIPLVLAFILWNERLRPMPVLRRIIQALPFLGVPLMLLVIAPWHLLAYHENGRFFIDQYFLLHHVKLLKGTDFNHAAPWYQYLPLLLAGFFPWSVFVPWSLKGASDDNASEERKMAHRFALCWAVVFVVLFSLMTSKLISYLLPMYAAAALLVGDRMARAIDENQGRAIGIHIAAIAAVAVSALGYGLFTLHKLNVTHKIERVHKDVPPDVITFAVYALSLLAIGTVISALVGLRSKQHWSVLALAATIAGFVGLTTEMGIPAIDRSMNRPVRDLARYAASRMTDGTPLAINIGRPAHYSALFYLPDQLFRKRLSRAQYEDGIVLEKGEKEPIEAFLAQHRPAYVLTDIEHADALNATTQALATERRDGRWVLLRADIVPPAPPTPPAVAPTVAQPSAQPTAATTPVAPTVPSAAQPLKPAQPTAPAATVAK